MWAASLLKFPHVASMTDLQLDNIALPDEELLGWTKFTDIQPLSASEYDLPLDLLEAIFKTESVLPSPLQPIQSVTTSIHQAMSAPQSEMQVDDLPLDLLEAVFKPDTTWTASVQPRVPDIPTPRQQTARKLCEAPGCVKYARCQGMCTQHGGRRYCEEVNCPRVAQFAGKCTAHGGIKPCNVPGCQRAVQSRGRCKTHGGGVRCQVAGCTKGSISRGRCRGHGGGMRCQVDECGKWAQREGCCVRHYRELVHYH
ncbi:hypothetical protein LEN26_016777 [Aphanomyces euteiches]|nr:hypothetical protein LEN26_016777 [Aphanomyces euteiches]KAH9105796.1 hypothetical protein AeMF1_018484 [Aphanomyces euteiches]KAH9186813.1 hypothetical protein AeNC1_011212 [Aphanomyces euteiches]